jgi:hypothetical protein
MILRLDVDRGYRPVSVGRLTWLLARAGYRPVYISQRRSPGGQGWHCEVAVTPVPRSAVLVTALQAILGSDRAREACNLQRARRVDGQRVAPWWRARWNVLYE